MICYVNGRYITGLSKPDLINKKLPLIHHWIDPIIGNNSEPSIPLSPNRPLPSEDFNRRFPISPGTKRAAAEEEDPLVDDRIGGSDTEVEELKDASSGDLVTLTILF